MSKLIVIPSNPADQKAIKDAVREASDSMVRIESEKEQIKTIVEMVSEKYELPKKFVNKLIRTYHKSTFDKEYQEQSDFQELYETIIR